MDEKILKKINEDNITSYIQENRGLRIKIEFLKEDIRILEEEKGVFRKDCNMLAELIQEFTKDLKQEEIKISNINIPMIKSTYKLIINGNIGRELLK